MSMRANTYSQPPKGHGSRASVWFLCGARPISNT
jgi:hypothetical protein